MNLLLILNGKYSFGQFTDEELRKIDLKLSNYSILSQENILLREHIKIIQNENIELKKLIKEQYNKKGEKFYNSFWFGFAVGLILQTVDIYLVFNVMK